ncbi:MAG: hypothetical protein Q8J78_03535, partial [Moraxellaceae bacterium]|nr:hypothetical protein [Moraxellaceae bacterium]
MKSELAYLTGVDSVARELAKATSWRDEIKHSLEPNLVSQYLDQQMSSLSASASTTASEYLGTATAAKFFEEQQRLVCDAVRPLARLR